MRTLLVNPRITSRRRARFPLSVLTLASALEAHGHEAGLIDGNHERDAVAASLGALRAQPHAALGLTVMGGPQVATAIAISRAVRQEFPQLPIIWGGYFPTLYPQAALNADYVDFLVRGQGEETLPALLEALGTGATFASIDGLSWKSAGQAVHNRVRAFRAPTLRTRLPYERLAHPRRYLVKTFMGARTASYEAALGCRFRCTFCGVAAMFRGATALPAAARLEADLTYLRDELGADSIQFYDHNFFDREEDMVPLLEVLARLRMPWWCYARADALLGLSSASWQLVRESGLRMAYIGAETPNDQMLRAIRKGTRADQTLEVAELCRKNGVIPELSFMVAPPDDPEGETERTFAFIRRLKQANPQAEIIVYVYTPLPASSLPANQRERAPELRDSAGAAVRFPATPEEWTERRWVEYSCHANAPWVSERLRRRIRDFVTVLNCRYPTLQDARSPPWAKSLLRAASAWRYRFGVYDRPWELDAAKRLVQLMDPRVSSI
jgi:anaerobic magnesium-protoporphyrin IX monomethyl ester cyclase